VTVLEVDYENERRGLAARCRREDSSEYTIAACDLVFPEGSKAAGYIAAYRMWLCIEPYQDVPLRKKPKATEDDLDMGKNVELIALAVRETPSPAASLARIMSSRSGLRVLGGRAGRDHHRIAAEEMALRRSSYLAGEITASRTDIPALGLRL